ncbi:MAG: FkbM family methyltransferase [Flavobacteriales bacterium]|nr:FkbM family methyltransferase [Flavobacteriales bacterium]
MSSAKRILNSIYRAIPLKQALFSPFRSSGLVSERIYKHLHFNGEFTVRIDDEASFRIRHYGYMLENELFWKGIEGVERIYRKLKANVALNNNKIQTLLALVSDHTGKATLYDQPHQEHVYSVSAEQDWNPKNSNLIPIELDSFTVTDILKHFDQRSVDLLKIDVETHEPAVLRGFADLIRKDRPSMLIEILNEKVASEVSEIISGIDYVYFNIDDVTWPPRQVTSLAKSEHLNFLICRPEVARSIGLILPSGTS